MPDGVYYTATHKGASTHLEEDAAEKFAGKKLRTVL